VRETSSRRSDFTLSEFTFTLSLINYCTKSEINAKVNPKVKSQINSLLQWLVARMRKYFLENI